MPKSSHLRVGEGDEKRDENIKHKLIIDDRILALIDEQLNELGEISPESPGSHRAKHERILLGLLLVVAERLDELINALGELLALEELARQ